MPRGESVDPAFATLVSVLHPKGGSPDLSRGFSNKPTTSFYLSAHLTLSNDTLTDMTDVAVDLDASAPALDKMRDEEEVGLVEFSCGALLMVN